MGGKAHKFQVDKSYLLKKFPGKGGWTYTEIPEIEQNKSNPFGWVKVSGFVDQHELKHYKLMPMGNGKLFLPVKAAIRKKIKKEAGDWVRVKLFIDKTPTEIPEEIIECFKNEPPKVYETFLSFTEGEQKAYIDWIYEAKKEDTKVERIVAMMGRVSQSKKFYD
ncbi:MAG: DUF1905 domain-containing protein [Cyclobacteriaceae bacterium]|nr:DUF1905 domain-containing protein [Cyclobacteriaceae bacterium]